MDFLKRAFWVQVLAVGMFWSDRCFIHAFVAPTRAQEPQGTKLLDSPLETMDGVPTISRRSAMYTAAQSAVASLLTLSVDPSAAAAAAAAAFVTDYPIAASWKSVDGLSSDQNFVGFDASAYQAMINDPNRTPQFFKAMEDRIVKGGAKTVLDLGTGPFAIFAIKAAELGAEQVYAIEANPDAAQLARETIAKKGFSDKIVVLEGFSTDLEVPNKVDLIVAEIIGSVASEEGVVATIADAHKRFAKNPNDPNTWIPSRVQTFAAPASYTLHNLFGPPGFDWSKLNGEPVRFNCRDQGLQLLSDPQLVEDIAFADILQYPLRNQKSLEFTVQESRISTNRETLVRELQANKLGKAQALRAAEATATSFTGLAFWPRLILPSGVIDSRNYPLGDHQKSHWQTVLPIMKDRPIPLQSGDSIRIQLDFEVPNGRNGTQDLQTPASYRLTGSLLSTADARSDADLM